MAAAAAGGALRQLLLPAIRQRLATGRQAGGTTMAAQRCHGAAERCVRSYLTEAAARQERTQQLLTREAARTQVALPLALVSLNAASLALAYYGPHIPRA